MTVIGTAMVVTMRLLHFVKVSAKLKKNDFENDTVPIDKCRLPYYGGCPLTRRCVTSDLDVDCTDCLTGFVEDPANPGGACLRKFVFASNYISQSMNCTYKTCTAGV